MKQQVTLCNELVRYRREVEKHLPAAERKRLVRILQHDMTEYIEQHPNATVLDLEQHFGTPAQFAADYMADQTDQPTKKHLSARRYLLIALIVLAVAAMVVGICAIILHYNLSQPDIDILITSSLEVSLPCLSV